MFPKESWQRYLCLRKAANLLDLTRTFLRWTAPLRSRYLRGWLGSTHQVIIITWMLIFHNSVVNFRFVRRLRTNQKGAACSWESSSRIVSADEGLIIVWITVIWTGDCFYQPPAFYCSPRCANVDGCVCNWVIESTSPRDDVCRRLPVSCRLHKVFLFVWKG